MHVHPRDLFFFSSSRRHTRSLRDWSSDVCSSDLDGNQKYYEARRDAPVFPELHGLVVKTVGIVEPLRAALVPIADDIDLAFVFGSVAKGSEREIGRASCRERVWM